MPTHQDAKAMARSLRDAMAERKVALRHSECLEIVARQFGFTDWNTLSAKLPPTDGSHRARSGAPEPLRCSFCRKSQHDVRSLIEGGCSRPQRAPENCVFICDECVTLCAQINADTVSGTVPLQEEQLEARPGVHHTL